LNNLPLYKDENFFYINNRYNSSMGKPEIITIEDKMTLLNYFIKVLPIYLIDIINFKFIDIKNIHIYFLFKTLLLKDYLRVKFNNLKLFKIKKLISYTKEIFLAKSLIKLNTYSEDTRYLTARRLY
jgi:hypothetical protein